MTTADLPALLRKIARHLEQKPANLRPTTPGAQAGLQLIASGTKIFLDTDTALSRARDFGGRGYAGGTTAEGRGSGGHSSPTEAAATHPDGFTQAGDELRAVLTEATGLAKDAARRTDTLLTSTPPLTEKEAARCTEWVRGCPDLATKAGRCAADYEYIRRTGASHVPEHVITERRRSARLAG